MPRKITSFMTASGLRFRITREALGYETVKELGTRLGISPKTIHSWELGENKVSPEKLKLLKDAFGVTSDWIYYGDASGLPRALSEKVYDKVV